jgi:hypothetical protein
VKSLTFHQIFCLYNIFSFPSKISHKYSYFLIILDDGKNQDRPETGTNPPPSPRGASRADGGPDFRILFYDYIIAESSSSQEIEDDLAQSVREVDRAKIPEEVKSNIYDKQGFFFDLFQNLYDQQQRELVHRYLDSNRVDDAKKQFEKDPQCLRYADRGGYTPLHRCAINDLVEPARLFLTHSLRWQSQQHDEPPLMDVNAMDGRRWTPLHWGMLIQIAAPPTTY